MLNVLVTALIALVAMSVVYWLIQKMAEAIDSWRLKKWNPPTDGIGLDENGAPIFKK